MAPKRIPRTVVRQVGAVVVVLEGYNSLRTGRSEPRIDVVRTDCYCQDVTTRHISGGAVINQEEINLRIGINRLLFVVLDVRINVGFNFMTGVNQRVRIVV